MWFAEHYLWKRILGISQYRIETSSPNLISPTCFLKKDFAFLVTSQSRVMAILSQKIHLFFRQDLQKFDFSLRGFYVRGSKEWIFIKPSKKLPKGLNWRILKTNYRGQPVNALPRHLSLPLPGIEMRNFEVFQNMSCCILIDTKFQKCITLYVYVE